MARDEAFELLGCQWIEPNAALQSEAADISTFVRIGKTGLGTGSALFEKTKRAARVIGYAWINATIRADNEGGLIYYQSRGFRTYGHQTGIELANGLVVDKVLKRFDLD